MLVERDGARAAERPRGRSWWMISRCANSRTEAMTLPCGGREALAVFSHEDEADLFLYLLGGEGAADGWRVRESRCGEVVSVLLGPCADADAVALDPLPEMAANGTTALVSVDRAGFLGRLLPRAGWPASPSVAAARPGRRLPRAPR